jgi:hypothetical protein
MATKFYEISIVLCSNGHIYSGDFAKFCGLLRIYEFYDMKQDCGKKNVSLLKLMKYSLPGIEYEMKLRKKNIEIMSLQ